jgi:DNA-binding NarL/FixJ family response regulator
MAVRASVVRVFVAGPDSGIPDLLKASSCEVAAAPGPVEVAILPLDIPEDRVLSMLAALRAANPKVRILAIARAADAATLRFADILGAQALLSRPVRPGVLLQRVIQLAREAPARY